MKKLISFFTIALFLCFSMNSYAQLASTYTFSTSTGATLEDMTGATVLQAAPNDDNPSLLTTFPGGFQFIYEGAVYTQFSTTPDGFMKLGSPVASAQFSNSVTSTTNVPKIFPMWDDLALGSAAGGGNVSYKLVGTTPNRKLVIQWFITIPRNTAGAANSTFQVWLNESSCGSGVIDILYGAGGNTPSSSVGINGAPATTNFQSVTVSTNTVSTVTANNSNAVWPGSGRRYTFTPPPPVNEIGVTASNLNNGRIFSPGKCYDFTATVTKSGPSVVNNVPVIYSVDGNDVATVNTGSLGCNSTEVLSFNGTLCNLSVGQHTIAIRTNSQTIANKPPLVILIDVLPKVVTLPYVQNFSAPDGWTILLTNPVGSTGIWGTVNAVNPDGVAADPTVKANFFGASLGRVEILRSREFDLSGYSNPVLNFYVAYKGYSSNNAEDRIEVLVSTDHGLTFFPASTPYNKTRFTAPDLSTLPSASGSFTPSAEIQWRHETVSLVNVANLGNVVIGFRATSEFGNNGWIDNVIVDNVNALCTDNVTGPGTYNCDASVSLNFLTLPLPPHIVGNVNDNQSVQPKVESKVEDQVSNIPTVIGEANVTSSTTQFDNPNGGTAFVSRYNNVNPGQSINPNIGGSEATSNDGLVSNPSSVYHDIWFTTTYDGNDTSGYATYNISIDYGSLFFTSPDQLYIVKRTDRTGAWTCLNTTRTGTVLTATGLTDFCDFGLAGSDALPVELASFASTINGRNVELNWATASENNNSGFDIERSSANGSWTKIANVSGNGTSTVGHSYSYTDRNLASGNYSYRLKQIDFNGNFEYFNLNNEVNIGVPSNFSLSQNYPNPFNPTTNLEFGISELGFVSLKVYDISGKEVMTLVNEQKAPGYYTVSFNGASLSSGIYFYTINAGSFVSTKKMTLIK